MFVNICQNALEIGTRAVKTIQLYQDITAVIEPSELKTENELINAKEKAQKKLKNLLNNKKKMGFHIFLDWR